MSCHCRPLPFSRKFCDYCKHMKQCRAFKKASYKTSDRYCHLSKAIKVRFAIKEGWTMQCDESILVTFYVQFWKISCQSHKWMEGDDECDAKETFWLVLDWCTLSKLFYSSVFVFSKDYVGGDLCGSKIIFCLLWIDFAYPSCAKAKLCFDIEFNLISFLSSLLPSLKTNKLGDGSICFHVFWGRF